MTNVSTDSSPNDTHMAQKKPYQCVMSKKRYKDIEIAVCEIEPDEDKQMAMLTRIKDIMHFDPDSKSITPEYVEKLRVERHRRAQEQGISIYKLLKHDEKYKYVRKTGT